MYFDRVSKLPPGECEMLYGRAGYLAALLTLAANGQALNMDISMELVKDLVQQGRRGAAAIGLTGQDGIFVSAQQLGFSLMYSWHDSAYLGAIHGVTGIMYVLVCAAEAGVLSDQIEANSLIEEVQLCTAALLAMRTATGNLPSSLGSSKDTLVQLCHGAPGLAFLCCKLSELLGPSGGSQYLKAALAASDVVWDRGLLKKGLGLCHGVAGNAYVFLACHRAAAAAGDSATAATQLHRAQQYALYAARTWKLAYGAPDRPMSLYEGLAGAVALWAHLMPSLSSPSTQVLAATKMPGFELNMRAVCVGMTEGAGCQPSSLT